MPSAGRRAVRALVDTSALLALSHARDQHHESAVAIAARHRAAGGTFVGTTLILGELHGHLLHLRTPAVARAALEHLLADPLHEWLDVGRELARDASANWLARYADQSFTLVDAVSFEVMRRSKLTEAFTFDRHFEIAGFRRLQ
jgi:predicted nucleic acid-binding protein